MLCFYFETSYLFVVGATPLQVTSNLGTAEPRRVCGSSGRFVFTSAQAPPRGVAKGTAAGKMLLCKCDVLV